MSDAELFEQMVAELMKSKKIKRLYATYVKKEIPFEDWVRNCAHSIMHPVTYDADKIIEDMDI